MKVLVSPLLLVAIAVAPLGADVLITEQVVAKAGGRDINGTRSIHVKRAHMRIDSVQAGASTSTVYDLREGVTILLNADKKRAELREIAARNAKLERDYPRARVTTTVKATQVTKEIAGATCAEHTYEIRVPMSEGRQSGVHADRRGVRGDGRPWRGRLRRSMPGPRLSAASCWAPHRITTSCSRWRERKPSSIGPWRISAASRTSST